DLTNRQANASPEESAHSRGTRIRPLAGRTRLRRSRQELLLPHRRPCFQGARRETEESNSTLPGELGRDERGIVAAEAEGIAHCEFDLRLARGVAYLGEIALRIGLLEMDGRRHDSVFDGQGACGELPPAGCAEQM